MIIKSATFKNFKCFEEITFEDFDPQFNLIIGENGSGKSSFLEGLREGMRELSNFGEKNAKLVRKIPMPNNGQITYETQYPSYTSLTIATNGKIKKTESSYLDSHKKYVEITEEEKIDSKDIYEYNERVSYDNDLINLFRNMPVSRAFIHLSSEYVENLAGLKYHRSQGLDDWNYPTKEKYINTPQYLLVNALINLWFDKAGDSLDTHITDKPIHGYDLISQCVIDCVDGMEKFDYSRREKNFVVKFKDQPATLIEHLSAGQNCLIFMIGDIARLCFMLNGNNLRETPGIVLIDELDLHLHPKWQRHIVGALKKTFPKIQFFATTHSPQIIGECRAEEIIILDDREEKGWKRPLASYGVSSNDILKNIMDAGERNKDVNVLIGQAFRAINTGQIAEAKKITQALRKQMGDSGDVIRLEAFLDRQIRAEVAE